MVKLNKQLTFGLIGAAGGSTGLSAAAGFCGGGCSTCLRCAGLGIVLVILALCKKKGGRSNGLAEKCD